MLIFVCGCDGYIGNALTQRLLKLGHDVYGFDNLSRRKNVQLMKSKSALPLYTMQEKAKLFNSYYTGSFKFFQEDLTSISSFLWGYIRDLKPEVIVNLAHMPSGPFSMISRNIASETLINNIIGNNNILWSLKEDSPDTHYITIGTTGEYDHYSNIDIEEGYMQISHKGRLSNEMIYPRRPGSIYHCCYDDKTELLTDNGWISFEEYNKKYMIWIDSKNKESIFPRVATLNINGGYLEYQNPTNIFKYNSPDEMIRIQNRSVDLLVTPNHKIFEYSRHDENNLSKWRLTEAKDLYGKNCVMKKSADYYANDVDFILPSCEVKTGTNSTKIEPEKIINKYHWVKFFGWWITEGSLYKNNIVISQQKEENYDDIKDAIYWLGLNRQIHVNKQYGKIVGFSIKCSQLASYLRQFGVSKEKYIPRDILNHTSKENLKVLLDTMLKGDGTKNGDGYMFYTSSKRLTDDVQELCLKCGLSATIGWSRENQYTVSITDNNTTQFIMSESVSVKRQTPMYSKEKGIGFVYCCEVPNGIIFVRRNGKSVWCGNSKTASTYLIDYLTRAWNLKCTDIQQSIVYGAYTEEIDAHYIFSRLDSDEAFGTVLNRFIIQAILGIPLTVYGKGNHQRGFLSLNDSIQALMIAVENPAQVGKVQVWNQLSNWMSMNEVAAIVQRVALNEYGIETSIQYIETPRMEKTESHYYHYVTDILKGYGYVPTRTMEEEVRYIFDNIMPFEHHLESLKNVVMPKIKFKREEKNGM